MGHWQYDQHGFMEIQIDEAILQAARRRERLYYDKYGDAGTHRKDKRRQRMTGYVAEEAVRVLYSPPLKTSTDVSTDFTYRNDTFDIKSQGCNSAPAPTYDGTLYKEQAVRVSTWLVFCRTQNDFATVWLAGFMDFWDYLQAATLLVAGQETCNFPVENDRYSLAYAYMRPPKELEVLLNPPDHLYVQGRLL